MIKALIFDLDDTLIDRNETTREFLYEQYDRIGDALKEAPKKEFADIILKYQEHGYGDKTIAYQKAFEKFRISGISIESLMEDFNENYGGNSVVFENVIPTLQLLSASYVLAMITNSRINWQNAKIDSAGLRPFFREILISDEFDFAKPDTRIFHLCADRLGVKPSECMYVGDHPVNDIAGALDAGMKAVWIMNTFYPAPDKTDAVLNDFSRLPEIVRGLST